MADIKPLQILEVQVPSSWAHTIDLTNSDQEEEVYPLAVIEEEGFVVPITEEEGDHLQDFIDLFNGKDKNNSIPVPEIQQPSSISKTSTAALLLSSI